MSRPAIALLRKDLRTTRIFWAPMAFSYGTFLLMFMETGGSSWPRAPRWPSSRPSPFWASTTAT